MDDNQNEYSKKYVNCIEYLKNLDLEKDEKRVLLATISTMMAQSANTVSLFTVAAVLGLDTEDPKFRTFYDNELKQIAEIDVNGIFDTLRELVLNEKDGE